jgi:serine/threonine protein kinase
MAKSDDKIGPYTLVRKLGRGAFGVVWLAEKRSVLATTKVALKFPNDEDVDLDAVKQEASLWVHASGHPNVLTFIDADVYDGQVVIVSEYAPDGSLSKWLEMHGGKAPTIEAAIEIMMGIMAGLEHLHKRGIIHRDIKPDNILLQNETPRLADFGIARILKTTSKSTIATGTPAYMPPEAFDGKRNEQTDIWSVGVIFYKLLTGRLPFSQTDISSLLMAIVAREPEPLPTALPQPIRRLIERTLEKNPEQRYRSAGEMRQALREARKLSEDSSSEAKTVLPLGIADLPTQTAQEMNTDASTGMSSPKQVEATLKSDQSIQHGQESQEASLQYSKELERRKLEEHQRREAEAAHREAEILRRREQEQRWDGSHAAPVYAAPPMTPVLPVSPSNLRTAPQSKRVIWIILSLSFITILSLILLIKYNSNNTSSNFGSSNSNASQTPSTSYPSRQNQPTSKPTPYTSPQSVAVRLRLLDQAPDHFTAADGVKVILQSSKQTFSQVTNSRGFVTFNSVPCGEEVEIDYKSVDANGKLLRIKTYLNCSISSSVDLGIYNTTSGDRLGSTESDLEGKVSTSQP